MRTLVHILLGVAILTVGFVPEARAQRTSEATVNADITLVQGLSVNEVIDVSFGTAAAGQSSTTISIDGAGNVTGNANGVTVGQIDLSGAEGQEVTVSHPSSVVLAPSSSGSSGISYYPQLYRGATTTTLMSGDPVTLDNTATEIYVGGSVDISDAESDSYTGSVTIDLEYTNI